MEKRCLFSHFNILAKTLDNTMRIKNKSHNDCKERNKPHYSVFMITYLENPEESNDELLEIKTLSRWS